MSENTSGDSAPEEPLPWARQSAKAASKPVTERARRLVTGLPSWDPMPPGEILVIRRRSE